MTNVKPAKEPASARTDSFMQREWLQENRAAITYYHRRVAEQGLLSDDADIRVRSPLEEGPAR